MKFEWNITNDAYGLGVMWDTPLVGENVEGKFAMHMLVFMFINLTFAIYWK